MFKDHNKEIRCNHVEMCMVRQAIKFAILCFPKSSQPSVIKAKYSTGDLFAEHWIAFPSFV